MHHEPNYTHICSQDVFLWLERAYSSALSSFELRGRACRSVLSKHLEEKAFKGCRRCEPEELFD